MLYLGTQSSVNNDVVVKEDYVGAIGIYYKYQCVQSLGSFAALDVPVEAVAGQPSTSIAI